MVNYSKLDCWLPYLSESSRIQTLSMTIILWYVFDVLSIILPVLHITKLFDWEPPGLIGFLGTQSLYFLSLFNSKISSFVVNCLVISFSWYLCVSWFICAATQINLALQLCRLTSAPLQCHCHNSTGTFLDTRISKQGLGIVRTGTGCMGLKVSAPWINATTRRFDELRPQRYPLFQALDNLLSLSARFLLLEHILIAKRTQREV